MWLLHGTSEDCYGATSFHSLSYTAAQSIVDHALTSLVAYVLGVWLHVEDPFLDLWDHGIVRVHLPAPASLPLAAVHPSGARVFMHWDPGSEQLRHSACRLQSAWSPCVQCCS